MNNLLEKTTLAGGCFWCLEAVYEQIEGIVEVLPGYCGGNQPNPSYEQVCTDLTGHAEVVQLTFDPSVVSFEDLLNVFFTIHDPTSLNQQGADIGTRYRSAIFYHSENQRGIAEEVMRTMTEKEIWPKPIVTELVSVAPFYVAEDYHHHYYRRNTYLPYCQIVIAPKVAKLRSYYLTMLKV